MKNLKDLVESKKLYTVKSGSTIHDVVLYMAEHNIGLVPVLDASNRLVGVFSERDLVRRIIAKNLDIATTIIDSAMSTELIVANIADTYENSLKKMTNSKVRHLLVIDNDKLVGIVSIRDLFEIDRSYLKETIEVLNNYIYTA
ncbi:MAG: CBS domain-containing protein [bacterium]